MKFATLIAENVRWSVNKNPFECLWAQTTTKEQLYEQLRQLGERYYHERSAVKCANTEFCLNYLALKKPTTFCQREVLRHFDGYWQRFVRLRSIFERGATYPSNGATRLEQVASLIAKCTGFCLEESELLDVLHDCKYLANLTEREMEVLPLVVDLYKINYFCAVGYQVFAHNRLAERALAKLVGKDKLPTNPTTKYGQSAYKSERLTAVCDVLGNSILSVDGTTVDISHNLLVYKCGRNVFDTFCNHSFWENCAYFESISDKINVTKHYFLQDGCEICNVKIAHLGKSKCKFFVDLPVACDGEQLNLWENALCFATKHFYLAVAVVCNDGKVKQTDGGLGISVALNPNQTLDFSVVTIVGESYQEVATKLAKTFHFGATRQGVFCGKEVCATYTTPLCLSPSSNCYFAPQESPAKRLNFTYQMGTDDVATFVDNAGHCATLLKGFVFGVGGEKVYAVDNGRFCKLNCGAFALDGKLTYAHPKSSCIVTHDDGKNIAIMHHVPQKTVVYLPFERQSKVTFCNNLFEVTDGLRHYQIRCCGKVESYTTNGLEFAPHRLRHKLSCDLESGQCLTICFAKDFQCSVVISSAQVTPPMAPIVQESLVSTYLNYINCKEVFCLTNYLKRPHPLALAGIVYTNPQFVKNYLQNLWDTTKQPVYYDNCGKLQRCAKEFLFDLATIYYATLVKDDAFPTTEMKSYVNTHLLGENCHGTDMVVQALCLKKASQIDGFDKVKCLVKFANLRKEIEQDTKLLAFAQVVGITPLQKPTKEYLKQLCNDLDIPKNWYYVSQLENLYGLSILGASVRICPMDCSAQLEQFALNFAGKRIDTTFEKCSVQMMTLNGIQCHQPFDPYSLKADKNTLVVSY